MATICASPLCKQVAVRLKPRSASKREHWLLIPVGAAFSRGPSSFSPLATTRSASSGSGLCNSSALGASANSHKSTSAGVVRMTGIAFGWIGATTAFASVVRKPNNSCCPSTGALFGPRTPRQGSIDQRTRTRAGLG